MASRSSSTFDRSLCFYHAAARENGLANTRLAKLDQNPSRSIASRSQTFASFARGVPIFDRLSIASMGQRSGTLRSEVYCAGMCAYVLRCPARLLKELSLHTVVARVNRSNRLHIRSINKVFRRGSTGRAQNFCRTWP